MSRLLQMSLDCGCKVKADKQTSIIGIEWCKRHGSDGDEAFEAMREALVYATQRLEALADSECVGDLNWQKRCRAALALADKVSK